MASWLCTASDCFTMNPSSRKRCANVECQRKASVTAISPTRRTTRAGTVFHDPNNLTTTSEEEGNPVKEDSPVFDLGWRGSPKRARDEEDPTVRAWAEALRATKKQEEEEEKVVVHLVDVKDDDDKPAALATKSTASDEEGSVTDVANDEAKDHASSDTEKCE